MSDAPRIPGAAARLDGLRQSTIREMTRLALQHGAVNLAQGFPDFPPPPEIVAAAHAALDAGHNQYAVTWGIPPLREAIAQTIARRYGVAYDPDRHVVVTCGVTEAICASVLAVANPGDEVIIVEPFHENYLPAVRFAGAREVYFALAPPRWELDPERLRRAFTPRTRAIIVNTPHNPTGRVFTRAELEGVAALCREFGAIAITDEIYDQIVHDGRTHVPIAALDGMKDRTVAIGGLGKTFAVTGWRLGYACAPDALSDAVRTVHDFLTICAPAPLQYAAAAALGMPEAYFESMRREYAERRDRMMSILDRHGFGATPPEGAYYVMSDFSALRFEGDDHALARHLACDVGVAVVPGSSFYGTPGLGRSTVRWAFAKRLETLDEVDRRLARLR
ncbi:MAG TPA: aminotransferase class I/II-fold pyridoxal phosphate-dependent enzyme [Candidatus Binatia bacterium]|nr:aminotransferase class I/II-fold pyridoxal phosphate-dependent enzyme [Candidatus Binatia bacterium]